MRIRRKEVYRFLLTYSMDNEWVSLSSYDEGQATVVAAMRFLRENNAASLHRKLSSALQCLTKNGWAYRETRNSHKYYIGEPMYYVEWRIAPDVIRRLKNYRDTPSLFNDELESALSSIPIS